MQFTHVEYEPLYCIYKLSNWHIYKLSTDKQVLEKTGKGKVHWVKCVATSGQGIYIHSQSRGFQQRTSEALRRNS